MTSHKTGGKELSEVLEVSDRPLFYQYDVNAIFFQCFVFFFQVQLYFLNCDWLCEGMVFCIGVGHV